MKAVSYRLLAAIATGTIAFVFTRRLDISLGIASVEALAKIICYYIHERFWSFKNSVGKNIRYLLCL